MWKLEALSIFIFVLSTEGCRLVFEKCTDSGQCCTSYCNELNYCYDFDPPQCATTRKTCDKDTDCCSRRCDLSKQGNKCQGGKIINADTCLKEDGTCYYNFQCCSKTCDSHQCKGSEYRNCIFNGSTCMRNGDCCSNNCVEKKGVKTCRKA